MKSLAELNEIRDRLKNSVDLREVKENRTRIVVGMATCGISAGAREVIVELVKEIDSCGVSDVVVLQTGCMGMCRFEPIVEVQKPGAEKVTYVNVSPDKARKIITEHVVNGKPIIEYTIGAAQTGGK